jgi:sugar lactone lactonase YvrE
MSKVAHHIFSVLVLSFMLNLVSVEVNAQNETYFFTTLSGSVHGHIDGNIDDALFRAPEGIAVDKLGNLYITEYRSSVVRKISVDGIVSTLAGKDMEMGFADGQRKDARFNRPHGLVVDDKMNVYVCDMKNCTIRKITPEGLVTTLAGIPEKQGANDGNISEATFFFPEDIAINSKGFLYVADTYNYTIREISPDGIVSTFAGFAGEAGFANGRGKKARFNKPVGIAIDGQDNIYVADSDYDNSENPCNCLIRKISPNGKVTTLAGVPNEAGNVDGKAKKARFNKPVGIDVTVNGIVYVADTEANLIRKIDKKGRVTTLGGKYLLEGYKNGMGEDALFFDPQALVVDTGGNLIICDTLNDIIRKGTKQNVQHSLK